MMEKQESHSNYKGFVAGVFSGIAKLSGKSTPHCSKTARDSEARELLRRDIELD
jgi:hypothetical protein